MGKNDAFVFRFTQGIKEVPVRAVFTKCYRPMVYFAGRLLNDHTEAEDVVVSAFEKLLKNPRAFEDLHHLESYLFMIVRNTCIDILRMRNRNAVWVTELQYLARGEKEEQTDYELMKARILQELMHEIEALPAQCRKIFKLMYIDGLNSDEVASNVGVSRKTVLNQKAKAIRILRDTLLKKKLFQVIFYGWLWLLNGV